MFSSIPLYVLDRMCELELRDAADRLDGTPRLQRLRQIPPETGRFIALIAASAPPGALLEIGTSAARLAGLGTGAQGARRSFFEGLLAVVLATPCSAPFLGSAVGFAFASDAATTFAVFAAIGAGLAAPFVAVSFVPSAGARLPRPGPWMLRLREALGLGLLATVGWLLWIGGRSAGVAGITRPEGS